MQHFLTLTLKTGKVEGVVTCQDHDECEANKLIREDTEEFEDCAEYPTFLEWYAGPVTPVRSSAINLELFDRFVKWSYVEDIDSLAAEAPKNNTSSLFYAPMMKSDYGIVHELNSTDSHDEETAQELYILEECLIGFISTYRGIETEFRPGFITLVSTGRAYFGEEGDLYWTYAE